MLCYYRDNNVKKQSNGNAGFRIVSKRWKCWNMLVT